jgi:hypothetical protein
MKMRSSGAIAILVICSSLALAADLQTFISDLNAKWIARDYNGLKQVFESRLAQNSNDLVALMLKAEYYTSIELNMAVARSTADRIGTVMNSLVWTSDPFARAALNAMRDSTYSTNEAIAAGYLYGLNSNQVEQLHTESPTNFPITSILPRYYAIQNP